jgi:hypothetical protein
LHVGDITSQSLRANSALTGNIGTTQGIASYVSMEPDYDQWGTWANPRNHGVLGFITVPSTSTNTLNQLVGCAGYVENYGSGNAHWILGTESWAYNQLANVTSQIIGAGIYSESDGGETPNLVGIDLWTGAYGGTVGTHSGIQIALDNGGATITNRYGISLAVPSGTATNDYGIYQEGTQKNYFGGPIGIGTDTPGSPLHVHSTTANQATFSGYAPLQGAATGSGSLALGSNPNWQGLIQYNEQGDTIWSFDNTWDAAGAITQFRLRTTGTPVIPLTLLGSGKVGIGNTAPPAQLYVRAPSSDYNTLSLSTPGYSYLQLLVDSGEKFEIGMGGGTNIWNWSANSIHIATNNSIRMTVSENGRIGVGTTTPIAPLHLHTSSVSEYPGIYITGPTTGTTATDGFQLGLDANANSAYVWNSQNSYIYFGTNNITRMNLTANGMLDIVYTFGRSVPVTKTGDFTLASYENWIICNKGSSLIITFPAASLWSGREVMIKTIQAQTVVSAGSDIVPLVGGAASTAILAATSGKWATLVSDGTNWVIMQGN